MMEDLPIISKDNVCTGHEECFSDCTNNFYYESETECDHSQDLGLWC